MTSRNGAGWAMMCWAILVLVSFGAKRFADPARRGRAETEGWRLLQAQLIDEARTDREVARLDLLEIYRDGLDGFQPISARLRPFPDFSPQRHGGLIDVGSADGVAVGQGVIGRSGVIGQVAEVDEMHSSIVFSDDPEFRASFRIEGKGRGVVAGGPGRDEFHPVIRLDPFSFDPGDLLLTSGEGTRFPRSLVLGVVRVAHIPIESTRIEPPPGTTDSQEVLILSLPQLRSGR